MCDGKQPQLDQRKQSVNSFPYLKSGTKKHQTKTKADPEIEINTKPLRSERENAEEEEEEHEESLFMLREREKTIKEGYSFTDDSSAFSPLGSEGFPPLLMERVGCRSQHKRRKKMMRLKIRI